MIVNSSLHSSLPVLRLSNIFTTTSTSKVVKSIWFYLPLVWETPEIQARADINSKESYSLPFHWQNDTAGPRYVLAPPRQSVRYSKGRIVGALVCFFMYWYWSDFIIIYLMLSPTSCFATRDFVAKLDVGPRVCGPRWNGFSVIRWFHSSARNV
jgi:hypothetical protein